MEVIGRKDRIDLPEFNLMSIEAKIDTGAYGNALHCHKIETIKDGDKEILSFDLLDPSHPEYEDRSYLTESFGITKVKNSGGIEENRYTINTRIILFDEERTITFSLTDRQSMKYPVLLGRKFLNKLYIVDVNQKDLSYKRKNTKK